MNLGSIIPFAKDMKTVSALYRDVVRLQPAAEQPFAEHRFLRFDTGSCQLRIHSAASPSGGRQKIRFHVDSVRAVHEALKSRGLRLRRLENEDGKACFDISDPEGNRIQIRGCY